MIVYVLGVIIMKHKSLLILLVLLIICTALEMSGILVRQTYGQVHEQNVIRATNSQVLTAIIIHAAFIPLLCLADYYAKMEGGRIIKIIVRFCFWGIILCIVIGILDLLGIIPRGIIRTD